MECEYSSIKSPFTSTFVGKIHSATLSQHFFEDALALAIIIKLNQEKTKKVKGLRNSTTFKGFN